MKKISEICELMGLKSKNGLLEISEDGDVVLCSNGRIVVDSRENSSVVYYEFLIAVGFDFSGYDMSRFEL